jgi:hypothetical protein
MAQRPGDPVALANVAVNRTLLEQLLVGAERASGGVGPWSSDGWVMRTHPDLTEVIEACAPDDLRIVLGVSTLATSRGVVYAVGRGTGELWLRIPAGPERDEALATDGVDAADGLADFVTLRAWRDDLAPWVRRSGALARQLEEVDA